MIEKVALGIKWISWWVLSYFLGFLVGNNVLNIQKWCRELLGKDGRTGYK
jgi:hypothetical protein